MKAATEKFENRLFFAFLALLVWLPLPLGSNRPQYEATFEIWVAVLSLLCIVLLQRHRVGAGEVFNGARSVLWLLAAWLIYIMLQLIPLPASIRQVLSPESFAMYSQTNETGWVPLSLHPYATFLFWLKSIAYVTLFALTLLLVNSKHRLVILGYALVFSAVFQAFYGSIMTLSGLEYGFFVKKYAHLGCATGTFANRNHLAGYLEMVSAIGIGLLMATSANKDHGHTWRHRVRNLLLLLLSQKFLLRLMLAMMVIALVLSRSRMGNTAFFLSLLIAGLTTLVVLRSKTDSVRKMFQSNDTRSAVVLITSLMIIDLCIVGAWFGVDKVVDRISQSSAGHDADRLEVSRDTLRLLKDYPLVGAGGGSYHAVFPRYRSESIREYFSHAHEDYLEITADVGAIGISLLALVVLSSLWAALKALHRRRDRLLRGMAFASIMGITALLIHSTVDFNLQIPANAATFMIILALGWIALNLDMQSNERVADSRRQETGHGK